MQDNSDREPGPLSKAPDHVKLAVDIIYLLESNNIEAEVALEAIEIVKSDLQQKLTESGSEK
ncbi:pleiotropic regulatory protein RsmS [Vibrio sp.]|uniref:pleiotropic regulatory protein RsmS n=1 Tax=Vibrio sp. TaxID=678 RepID=UPI003D0BEDC9